MFDFLKKKIADFTGKIKDALKARPAEGKPQDKLQEAQGKPSTETEKPVAAEPVQEAQEAIEIRREEEKVVEEKAAETAPTEETTAKEQSKERQLVKGRIEELPEAALPEHETKTVAEPAKEKVTEKKAEDKPQQETRTARKFATQTQATQKPKPEILDEDTASAQPERMPHALDFEIAGESKKPLEKVKEICGEEKRELKAKVGLAQKILGVVGGKIKISEKETKEFFEEFELSLLEADVQQDAAEAIAKELKFRIVGKEISSREDITEFIKKEVRESLLTVMHTKSIDLFGMAGRQRPLKIMFLGPNGAGKTTTIAKVAKRFMLGGKSVIMAAGDTFRAASIEQLENHANALGVKIVKHKYGSDPAAVAFDAVKAAEAKGIDVVLIDTAGRQETNRNLVEELKKVVRVAKPDLKLYVGEAYTGQALLEQAAEFDKAIGIDGFVLTKIDTDTKGGTAISLLYSLKKPIVFVGTGQRYEDLIEFRPEFIVDRIL